MELEESTKEEGTPRAFTKVCLIKFMVQLNYAREQLFNGFPLFCSISNPEQSTPFDEPFCEIKHKNELERELQQEKPSSSKQQGAADMHTYIYINIYVIYLCTFIYYR